MEIDSQGGNSSRGNPNSRGRGNPNSRVGYRGRGGQNNSNNNFNNNNNSNNNFSNNNNNNNFNNNNNTNNFNQGQRGRGRAQNFNNNSNNNFNNNNQGPRGRGNRGRGRGRGGGDGGGDMQVETDDDSQSVPMSMDGGNTNLFGGQSSNPFQNQNQNQNSPFQSNRGRGGQAQRGRGRGRGGNNSQDAMMIEDDTPSTSSFPFQSGNNNNNNTSLFGASSRGTGRGRGTQPPRGRGRGQSNFRGGQGSEMMIEDNGASSLFGNSNNGQPPSNFNKNPANNFNKPKPQKTMLDFSGDVSMDGEAPNHYSPKKPMTRSRTLFDAQMNIEDQPPKPRVPMSSSPKKIKIPAKINLFADRGQSISPTNEVTMSGNAPNNKRPTSNLFKIRSGQNVDMNDDDDSMQQQQPQISSRKQNSQQQGLFNPKNQNKNFPLLTKSNNAPIYIDEDDNNGGHVLPASPRARGRFQQQGDDDGYEKMSYQPMQQHQQKPQAGRGQSLGRGRGQPQQQQQQQPLGRGQSAGRGQQGAGRGQPIGNKAWEPKQTMPVRRNSYNNDDEENEDEYEEQPQMSDGPRKARPNQQQQNLGRNKRMNVQQQQIQSGRQNRRGNNEEQEEMTYQSQIPLKRPRRAVPSGQEDEEDTGEEQKNAYKYQRGAMDNQRIRKMETKQTQMPARRNSGQGKAIRGKYADQEEEVDEEYDEDPDNFTITRTISNDNNEEDDDSYPTQTLTQRGARFGGTNSQPSRQQSFNNNYDESMPARATQIAADLAKKKADILELKQRISSKSATRTSTKTTKKLVPSRVVHQDPEEGSKNKQKKKEKGEGKKHSDLFGHEKPLVGTCTTMCPVKEMNMRAESKNLQYYERVRGTENHPLPQTNLQLCVKEFKKIDAIVGVEADQLRTMETLQETMSYLLHVVLADDRLDLPYYLLYGFICDRIRSVIQDATVQHFPQTYTLASLEIFQKAVRLFILSDQILCADSADNFDPKLQKERLNKALISINEHCTILRSQHIYTPDEPEFTAYLMLLSDHENHLKQIWGAPKHIAQSEVVKFVIKVKSAISNNNYVAFFKLFDEADIVIAALMHNWFERVRRKAFESLQKMKILEVAFVTRALNFESTEQTLEYLLHFGIEPTSDGIIEFNKDTFSAHNIEPFPRSRSQKLVDQIEKDSSELIRLIDSPLLIRMKKEDEYKRYQELCKEISESERAAINLTDDSHHYIYEKHEEEEFEEEHEDEDDENQEEYEEDEENQEEYEEENDNLEGFKIRVKHSDEDLEDVGEKGDEDYEEEGEEYDQENGEHFEDQEHEVEYDEDGNPYPAEEDDTHAQYDENGNLIEGEEEDAHGYDEADENYDENEGEEEGEREHEEYENEEYDENQVHYDENGEPLQDENEHENYEDQEGAEYENEEDGEEHGHEHEENYQQSEQPIFNNPLFNTSKTVSTPVIDTLSPKQQREVNFQRVFPDAMALIHSARSKYLTIQYAEIWRDKTKRMIPLWRQQEDQAQREEEKKLIEHQRKLFQKNQEEKLAREEYEIEMKEIEELAKLQVSGEYYEVSCPRTLKDIQKEFSKQYLISDTYLKWSMQQNQIHIDFLAEYQSKPQRFYSPVLFKKEDYKK